MQTTLRINDQLYREAKTEAARQGITITHFIEQALKLKLQQQDLKTGPVSLPVFKSKAAFDFTANELKTLGQTSEEDYGLRKLKP